MTGKVNENPDSGPLLGLGLGEGLGRAAEARYLASEMRSPKGRPRFEVSEDGKCIDDDDFLFDAMLLVKGDFFSDDERREFAQWIASALNEADMKLPRRPPPHWFSDLCKVLGRSAQKGKQMLDRLLIALRLKKKLQRNAPRVLRPKDLLRPENRGLRVDYPGHVPPRPMPAPAPDTIRDGSEMRERFGSLPEWDDVSVQAVYELLCSEDVPPEGEHWEGFTARRIVAALRATTRDEIQRLKDALGAEQAANADADSERRASFDFVLGGYAEACRKLDADGMRRGYCDLRAMLVAKTA